MLACSLWKFTRSRNALPDVIVCYVVVLFVFFLSVLIVGMPGMSTMLFLLVVTCQWYVGVHWSVHEFVLTLRISYMYMCCVIELVLNTCVTVIFLNCVGFRLLVRPQQYEI